MGTSTPWRIVLGSAIAISCMGRGSCVLAELPAVKARDDKQPAAVRPMQTMLFGAASPIPPDETFLKFVEEVRPDVLVTGTFDARLYAMAALPDEKARRSPDELLRAWKGVIDRLHKSGIRVIGQMEINVVSDRPADLAEGTGFIGYYDRHWNEKLLGRRPTATAKELLEEPDCDDIGHHHAAHLKPGEKLADTIARCGCRVNPRALNGCLAKPAWRETQARMVTVAIDAGVDGFITNRNYFGHCGCEQCRRQFSEWLANHYTAAERKQRFGITDLTKFENTCVVGAHRDPEQVPNELVIEKVRFSKHLVQGAFALIYVRHAKDIKPELIASQWNHMAYFDELHLDRGHLPPSTRTSLAHAMADERWSLPVPLWGDREDYFWYCNWGTTQNTILSKQYAGDTVLYGKLLRELARGRAYTINKYDYYRPRNMMAEAAALGYTTNAINTPWQNPEDREVITRYFAFLKKHAALYRGTESLAEVALTFPRRAIHAGDASPLEYVEAAGRAMIRGHVLFDLLPDDMLCGELGQGRKLSDYRAIFVTGHEYLDAAEADALRKYVELGGRLYVLAVDPADRTKAATSQWAAGFLKRAKCDIPGAIEIRSGRTNVERVVAALDELRNEKPRADKRANDNPGADERGTGLSSFEAPWTVEVSAYRQPASTERTGKRLVLHLVNYNHDEQGKGKSVSAQESPIAAEPVAVRLRLPAGFQTRRVHFYSPDEVGRDAKAIDNAGEAASISFQQIAATKLDATTNNQAEKSGAKKKGVKQSKAMEQARDVLEFRTPGFLVYGVCVIEE